MLSRFAVAPMRRTAGVRTFLTQLKKNPNYETYKERTVMAVIIIACVLSSFPILVPDSYFIHQKEAHDAEVHAHADDEDEEEEE